MSSPVTSVAQYRVPVERIDELLEIIDRHAAVLRELELITDREPEVYAGTDKGGGGFILEIFDWVDADASDRAHTHPMVSAVWEAMGPLGEVRDGRPPFEFTNLDRVRGR